MAAMAGPISRLNVNCRIYGNNYKFRCEIETVPNWDIMRNIENIALCPKSNAGKAAAKWCKSHHPDAWPFQFFYHLAYQQVAADIFLHNGTDRISTTFHHFLSCQHMFGSGKRKKTPAICISMKPWPLCCKFNLNHLLHGSLIVK